MSVRDEPELARMLRLCLELGLPEVMESTSYGAPSLKVKNRNFASVRGPQEMVLHCPLEQKDLLMEMAPEIYWQTDHFKSWPGLLVRLEAIGDEELKLRLEDAWRFRAPKRLADAYAVRKGCRFRREGERPAFVAPPFRPAGHLPFEHSSQGLLR